MNTAEPAAIPRNDLLGPSSAGPIGHLHQNVPLVLRQDGRNSPSRPCHEEQPVESLKLRQVRTLLVRLSVLVGIFLTQTAQVPVHEIFVTDFGAKCDGVTDDTAAFDAAHAALPVGAPGDVAPGGGTIVLPRGGCLVNNWTVTKSALVVSGMGH